MCLNVNRNGCKMSIWLILALSISARVRDRARGVALSVSLSTSPSSCLFSFLLQLHHICYSRYRTAVAEAIGNHFGACVQELMEFFFISVSPESDWTISAAAGEREKKSLDLLTFYSAGFSCVKYFVTVAHWDSVVIHRSAGYWIQHNPLQPKNGSSTNLELVHLANQLRNSCFSTTLHHCMHQLCCCQSVSKDWILDIKAWTSPWLPVAILILF